MSGNPKKSHDLFPPPLTHTHQFFYCPMAGPNTYGHTYLVRWVEASRILPNFYGSRVSLDGILKFSTLICLIPSMCPDMGYKITIL